MNSEIVIYQAEDGKTKIDVRMEDETVWLTQLQMAELFQTTKQNINLHINNAFEEGELLPEATVKEYLTVQKEGVRDVSRHIKPAVLIYKEFNCKIREEREVFTLFLVLCDLCGCIFSKTKDEPTQAERDYLASIKQVQKKIEETRR
jgi:hypothetical protein